LNFHLLRHFPRSRFLALLGFILALGLFLWPSRQLRSDNFVFYFPGSRHVLPVETIESSKYLPLLQVLNLLGKVGGLREKRNSLKVFFGSTELEFRRDEKKVRLDKNSYDLQNPVRLLNGQWIVPVDFITQVIPHLTHQMVEYQMGADRIFIGDVRPASFSVRLDRLSNGVRLTVQFTDVVSVRTASRNGKWIMFLGDRPVEPLEPAYHFLQNPYVSELRFDDQDGIPKLVLTPSAPGLNFYPVLAEGGKILLADVLKPPPVVAQPSEPQAEQPPATASTTPSAGQAPPPGVTAESPAAPPGPPLPVVVLDAGHGGADTGAHSRDGILEKDLVAQYVARVRLALLTTGNYRIVLTRTGDVNVSFEDRTNAANLAHALCFLTFHAGDLGPASLQVAVYTYQFPTPPAASTPDTPRSIFVPWDQVQVAFFDRSRQFATELQHQLATIPGLTTDAPVPAPVRTLRSINAPAVALEIGRLAPDADAAPLTNSNLQQQVANAIISALATLKGGV
jgi:N-acetylmuramoyl-L-alanine amidase